MRINRKRTTERDAVPEHRRAFSHRSAHRSGRDGRKAGTGDARASAGIRWTFLAVGLIAAALLQSAVFAQGEGGGTGGGGGGVIVRSLVIVFFLTLISGLFAMAEAALLSVRRTRIDQLVEEGNRSARMVAQILNEPTRMLSTIQVGITLIGLFSAGAAAETIVGPFEAWLKGQFPGTSLARYAYPISFGVIIMGVSLMTLVIGEITPKSLAIRFSERVALLAAYPLRLVQFITTPFVWVVTGLSNLLVRPFGVSAGFHPSAMSEDELRLLVEQSEEHGVIETEEKEMIHSIFDFAETVVRKVMTPRLDITAIEADVETEELLRVVTESGHSRLPVYDDNLDNLVGIIHVKDVLRSVSTGTPVNIRDLMRPPYFIPENKRVDDLLREFRRSKIQMAIVRDEFGTVVGVVSIEDLLEEIVGDIQDEYDMEEEPDVTPVDEFTSIVDGMMTLEDFNERMGVELPVEEADTIGGFVFGLLGHQPAEGEAASWDGLEFKVEATDGRRIQKVRICRIPASETEDNSLTPADTPPTP